MKLSSISAKAEMYRLNILAYKRFYKKPNGIQIKSSFDWTHNNKNNIFVVLMAQYIKTR